jgi:streptomycin 6-kinase
MKIKLVIAGWYTITTSDGSVYDLKRATHGRISSDDGWFVIDPKGARFARGRTKADALSSLKSIVGAKG